MSIQSALDALRRDPRLARNVAVWQHLPARPAVYAALPSELDAQLAGALRGRGVDALYRHQAEAVAAALDGAHVAIVTPAASGKTLCYNLPVLQRLLADPRARALYLFPTKALAQDQLAALSELAGPTLSCATYDGDTPQSRRARIRDGARIILSNPDMLHAGILPQHTRWAGFFANLRVVVLDEMHVYRGIFGSHVADVLRRLRRICQFYGSNPQFLLASATIANPAELAGRLTEAPVTVIGPEQNGAPQGERHILLYNPPLLDPALGIRRSSSLEATELAAHFLAQDVQTIVFAGSRLTTELIITYLRERPERLPQVAGYRGGYLSQERRVIERDLREGRLRGVVATNALELGIDIGQLEAAVLAGYPGTIASTWQQMGRAGRRQSASVAVLVATPNPIDQYLISHPEYLFERSPERALLNPDNPVILAGHLTCAAAELPFRPGEGLGAAPDVAGALAFLTQEGELYSSEGRYYWAGEGYPASAISLRAGGADRVIIQTQTAGGVEALGELDRGSVPLLLYENAIYIHAGETYIVEHLDWDAGLAHVRPVQVDYYTQPSIAQDVDVLAEDEACFITAPATAVSLSAGGPENLALKARAGWGDVQVTTRGTGYRLIRRYTNEVLGFGEINLPEQVLETAGCWLALLPGLTDALKAEGAWLSAPNDYGPEWQAQRAAARARDGFRCQGCGALEPAAGGPGGRREHDVHHKIPLRAFVADASLRPGLPPEQAWQAANRLENLVTLCPACHRRAEAGVRLRSGLGGLAALLVAVAPLYLMCDPRDLGVAAEPQAPVTGLPTITLYEKVPAGVGYAAEIYHLLPELLRAAFDLVQGCACQSGCPACVGPVVEHEYALDAKELTRALLAKLMVRT
jgi:DEAD/DEAH box helicase domain-containing protein